MQITADKRTDTAQNNAPNNTETIIIPLKSKIVRPTERLRTLSSVVEGKRFDLGFLTKTDGEEEVVTEVEKEDEEDDDEVEIKEGLLLANILLPSEACITFSGQPFKF